MLVPYDDRDGWIWLDGRWTQWRDARVHVLTHGLHYASAVFEGTRAYGGHIFACEAHTARLFASAQALNMDVPYNQDEINRITRECLTKNNLTDAYIRPLVWRGPEQMGVAGLATKVHVMVAAWAWPSYFSPEQHARGLRLMDAPYRRVPPMSAPIHAKASGLYMTSTLIKQAAEQQGFDDAMVLDWRGHVAEACVANLFFIKDGALHTPVPDAFLNGITRQTVIELAKKRGIAVHERTILQEEVPGFDQAFLTGTAAEVAPIGEIAGHKFSLGGLAMQLADDYAQHVRNPSL